MVRTSALALQAYLILQWVSLSSLIILFNKYLLSDAGFHFPLTLVIMHMCFITFATQVWALLGWAEVPAVSREDLLTRLLPIALFFALSLGLGNAAYLYISVAFVQMLKATTPVAVLLTSFAFGLEQPSPRLALYIVLISSGIGTACAANVELNTLGLLVQLGAVVTEAVRLALVQLTLSGRYKFSPIGFLYYAAPLCAAVLALPWLFFEGEAVTRHRGAAFRRVGAAMLLANASVAFLLNLSTMALIKNTSALTLNVSGVFKDLFLIGWSVVVSSAVVSATQWTGYGVAMVGVLGYSHYKRAKQAAAEEAARAATLQKCDAVFADRGSEAESDATCSDAPLLNGADTSGEVDEAGSLPGSPAHSPAREPPRGTPDQCESGLR